MQLAAIFAWEGCCLTLDHLNNDSNTLIKNAS